MTEQQIQELQKMAAQQQPTQPAPAAPASQGLIWKILQNLREPRDFIWFAERRLKGKA